MAENCMTRVSRFIFLECCIYIYMQCYACGRMIIDKSNLHWTSWSWSMDAGAQYKVLSHFLISCARVQLENRNQKMFYSIEDFVIGRTQSFDLQIVQLLHQFQVPKSRVAFLMWWSSVREPPNISLGGQLP